MDPEKRPQAIKAILEKELDAAHVEVVDQSAVHAGHPGSAAGGGHFQVLVVAKSFAGLNRVAAQRLVYAALGDFMQTEIHALSMRTLTPEQWSRR